MNKKYIIAFLIIALFAIMLFLLKSFFNSENDNPSEYEIAYSHVDQQNNYSQTEITPPNINTQVYIETELSNGEIGYFAPKPKVPSKWSIYYDEAIKSLLSKGAKKVTKGQSDFHNYVSITEGKCIVPIHYIEMFIKGHDYIQPEELVSFAETVNSGNIFQCNNEQYLNLYEEIQSQIDYELNRQRTTESIKHEIFEHSTELSYSNITTNDAIFHRTSIFQLNKILKERGID